MGETMTKRGKLNKRLTLQSESRADGGSGSTTKVFTDIADVWGKIKTKRLAPVVRGDSIEYPVLHEIIVPWSKTYAAARRITYEDQNRLRTFSVQTWFNVDEANEDLMFVCEEKQNV